MPVRFWRNVTGFPSSPCARSVPFTAILHTPSKRTSTPAKIVRDARASTYASCVTMYGLPKGSHVTSPVMRSGTSVPSGRIGFGAPHRPDFKASGLAIERTAKTESRTTSAMVRPAPSDISSSRCLNDRYAIKIVGPRVGTPAFGLFRQTSRESLPRIRCAAARNRTRAHPFIRQLAGGHYAVDPQRIASAGFDNHPTILNMEGRIHNPFPPEERTPDAG